LPSFIAARTRVSSSLTSATDINSARARAASNTFRISGRRRAARPPPAKGFTNTATGAPEQNEPQFALEVSTAQSCCPTRGGLSIAAERREAVRAVCAILFPLERLRRPRQESQLCYFPKASG